jgi:hypothetical protein
MGFSDEPSIGKKESEVKDDSRGLAEADNRMEIPILEKHIAK